MKPRGLTARTIVALGFALCTVCVFAAPVPIGFVAPDEEPRYTNLLLGLRQGLQAAGVGAESATIVEHRVRRGDLAKARNAAESLRAGNARLAFVVGTELAKSVRSAAKELPIVFITPGDPVRAGLAASLARPGNNLTGMTFEFAELLAKRLELLKEILWGQRCRCGPKRGAAGRLRAERPSRRRTAHRAADPVRAGGEPQGCQGARHHDSAERAAARR